MAALTRFLRRRTRLAAAVPVVFLLFVSFAAGQAPSPQTTPPATAAADMDPQALLDGANTAFGQADFEKVRDLALRAASALEQGPARPADPVVRRSLLARALDLAAQAYFNLGDKTSMQQTMDRLLAVDPGRRVDPAQAGAKFVGLLEERRRKLVGRLALSCTPLPCDEAVIDGEPFTPGQDGTVSALAGARNVAVGRRNFRSRDLGSVVVNAGADTPVSAVLEQSTRDVVITTIPAGARVTVDGKDAGATPPGQDAQGPSGPLVAPSLAPGPHVVVLQAPCRRRLEQAVEVVLDAQNFEPLGLGPLTLEKSRASLDVVWTGAAGVLVLDGQPIEPGRRDVCPGVHNVSLSVGGRRVWFDAVELRDEESRSLAPQPRPTVAIVAGSTVLAGLGLPGTAWNGVALEPTAASRLEAAVSEQLGPDAAVPVHPAVARRQAQGLAALAGAAAPEADLVALVLPGLGAVRSLNVLALLDTHRDVVELTSWPEKDAKAAAQLAAELARPLTVGVLTTGFDLAERVARPPVVAAVLPDSPAAKAGLAPGQVLVAVDGKAVSGDQEALARLESGLSLERNIVVKVEDQVGVEREVQFKPILAVNAPDPASLAQRSGALLLPLLARAAVDRIAGTPMERVGGGVLEGLGLAALGLEPDAATALDRAVIDDQLDPAQDARGTVNYVLEHLLRRLHRGDYADEVRARWMVLQLARFGGRDGPPLPAARGAPEE